MLIATQLLGKNNNVITKIRIQIKENPMIVDPNYQQELEKYENPVPSREFILQTNLMHQ